MAAKAPKVSILNVTRLEPAGTVKALLRVQVGGFTFNDCRLVYPHSRKLPVVLPPMDRWREADGTKRYRAVCQWPKDVRLAINAAALALMEAVG